MAFGKKRQELVMAVSRLQAADFSKEPELGEIYRRVSNGRVGFIDVFERDLNAVMAISSLDLALNHHVERMLGISSDVANATEVIFEAAGESAAVAGQVNEQHEDLTNTIIRASEETEEVYKKIEAGQEELTNIKELSSQTIEVSKEMQKDMDELFGLLADLGVDPDEQEPEASGDEVPEAMLPDESACAECFHRGCTCR